MSVVTKAPKSGVKPYRLTVEQFLKMITAGIFPEGAHVELLGGLLVDKRTKHAPHSFSVGNLAEALRGLVPLGWLVSEEKAVLLGENWRPEPDIAVARGPRDRYRAQSPRAEDLALVIEISDSSYTADRGAKWKRYAACGIASYWIVNIPARVVEVYGDPSGEGRSAGYRDAKSFGPDDRIPVTFEGAEVGRIAVRDVLP